MNEPEVHPVYEDPKNLPGYVDEAIKWLNNSAASANNLLGVAFQGTTHTGMALASLSVAHKLGNLHFLGPQQQENLRRALYNQEFQLFLVKGTIDIALKVNKHMTERLDDIDGEREDCLVTHFHSDEE